MRISRDYINSQSFDVVGNGREIRINCPNCDDTTKHLYVNQDRNVYHCFKCGAGGVIQTSNEPNLEQFDIKTKYTKEQINRQRQEYNKLYKLVDKAVIKSLPPNIGAYEYNKHHPAYKYLIDRGIISDEVRDYDIRVATDKNGICKNSIIFPVCNSIGNLKYFVCRKYDRSEPKYINAPWPKNDTLFITMSKYASRNVTVIVEGIFDALAIARLGYRGIALLGKKATAQQLDRLSKMSTTFLIYLDTDALSHAIQLKLQLSTLGHVTNSLIRHDKDAADLYVEDPKALRGVIEHALKY